MDAQGDPKLSKPTLERSLKLPDFQVSSYQTFKFCDMEGFGYIIILWKYDQAFRASVSMIGKLNRLTGKDSTQRKLY